MADAFGLAVNIATVVDLFVKIGVQCSVYCANVKAAPRDIRDILNEADRFGATLKDIQRVLAGPNRTNIETLQNLCSGIGACHLLLDDLATKLEQGTRARLVWPFKRHEVDSILAKLKGHRTAISLDLQIHQNAILGALQNDITLGKLRAVERAGFDAHTDTDNSTCLAGTRTNILSQIKEWHASHNSKNIFWLNGMAGTGKSTISRTIAKKFNDENLLGASFFFKRGEGDRGRAALFFPTIITQLIRRMPSLAAYVRDEIEADPILHTRHINDQFEKLVVRPIKKLPQTSFASCIIIIDALDECDDLNDIRLIVRLISEWMRSISTGLKFLVTSRPELLIQLGFQEIYGQYDDLVLHEIPESDIKHDITLFMKHELAKIRQDYNINVRPDRQLPSNWPDADIQKLIEMAVPLFIFAATICRYLQDRRIGSPKDQLMKVLQYQGSLRSNLDKTYLPVLDQLFIGLTEPERDEVAKNFKRIIGSIVLLAAPLSASTLAQLLDISRDSIDNQLDLLHSVLNIPPDPDSPIRLLHLSFRDFLTDPAKNKDTLFWIDKSQTHRDILTNCLRVMNQNLHRDICDMRNPGIARSAIDCQSILHHIPQELEYSCLNWVHHLENGSIRTSDGIEVHLFLSRHILHWLEALSLMGRASEISSMLQKLHTLSKSLQSGRLSSFLYDAIRFVRFHFSTIDLYPLQIYSSLIAFSPVESHIHNLFHKDMPDWLSINGDLEKSWDLCSQTLEGHDSWVNSVTFSPDSMLIASASNDHTVRIWHADTGQTVQILKGHSDSVNSVMFSPDSTLVASASSDHTVRIWYINTGQTMQMLKGHNKPVHSVIFSPNFLLVASASDDYTVRIWHADTGQIIQILEGHSASVRSVMFSSDSTLVLSASWDRTVRIWYANTGQVVQKLRHPHWINSAVFSPDSMLIAAASDDRTVRIMHADTGQIMQILKGHSDSVKSVMFSSDSTLVISASEDRTVRIWRANTGQAIQILRHSHWVTSAVFSPDSTLIASASKNHMVRIWHANIDQTMQTFKGHSDWVNSITFSPDSRLIASASNDNTVRIWRADIGQTINTLKGHRHLVRSVVFSPDSTLIASASEDETVRIWRVDIGQTIKTLKGYDNPINSVIFSPNSMLVASASKGGTVQIWCVNTGQLMLRLEGHNRFVGGIIFLKRSVVLPPEIKLIRSISGDGTVRIRRADTGQTMLTGYIPSRNQTGLVSSDGHDCSVNSVAFSLDSTLVASASDDQTVRIWRADMGQTVQILKGHSGSVRSVVFSSDSTLVASSSDDGTVRIWRADTSQTLQSFHINATSSQLSFVCNNARLQTDFGLLTMDGSHLSHPSTQRPSQVSNNIYFGCGLAVNRCWITWGGQKVLWLPADFRPSCSAILGSTIAIGSSSGRMVFIKLTSSELHGVLLI